ncbi:MAG: lipid-binding SYLF domain-containing protein [Gemmatimonadaceae bacterium]|nr:lipid-binding SYLF domain-containing protein [Gemmatimonadaceae bacterium]
MTALVALFAIGVRATPALAQDREDDRLAKRAQRAGEVLAELVSVPDRSPPKSLLAKATCVAVVPHVIQAGLGFGGRVGYGLVSCRTPGGWSRPSFVGLKGGSFGLQIGGQAADIVLVFVNRNAPATTASSSFDLGGEASVAAGPLGRNASAETDYKLDAEIYSYSKSKGLFAGIKIAGTKWEIDYDANRRMYAAAPEGMRGEDAKSVARLLTTPAEGAPQALAPFLTSLEQHVGAGVTRK